MFTRCPECQKTQALTLEQLRSGRGMLRCDHCSALFDALASIGETEAVDTDIKPASPLPWDRKQQAKPIYWNLGLGFGLILLLTQLIYFEGPRLSQQPGLRLWIEKICAQLGCNPPAYKNNAEFEVIHRSFTQAPDQHYDFRIVFSNQASFRQNYPDINLTLLNFSGEPFAHRVFSPKDYLPDASIAQAIEADATTEINLKIAAPKTKVGGYDFDFL